MSAISSLYIPCVEKNINAEFIANVFEKNGIAMVSRIAIESIKNTGAKFNRVYIGINYWFDTEAAYNFIWRLKNPAFEARIIYEDDNWWPVSINKFPHKLFSEYGKGRLLTIFNQNVDMDFFETEEAYEEIKIDIEKTNQLKAIIAGFNKKNDEDDFNDYLREMEEERALWISEQ